MVNKRTSYTEKVSVHTRGHNNLFWFCVEKFVIMSRSTTRVCRLCCSSSSSTRCSALFSKEAIQRDLPGRLSNLLQLPVSDSDGLSSYLCRSCMGKFTTVESKLESFRSMAKAGYEKGRQESQVPISSFYGSNPL